jgi:hypothetical protein
MPSWRYYFMWKILKEKPYCRISHVCLHVCHPTGMSKEVQKLNRTGTRTSLMSPLPVGRSRKTGRGTTLSSRGSGRRQQIPHRAVSPCPSCAAGLHRYEALLVEHEELQHHLVKFVHWSTPINKGRENWQVQLESELQSNSTCTSATRGHQGF